MTSNHGSRFVALVFVAVCSLRAPVEAYSAEPAVSKQEAKLLEQRPIKKGAVTQGMALTEKHYFAANSHSICRFDKNWNLLEEKQIRIKGVNHVGAIDYHDGYLWVGLLHGPSKGKYDKNSGKVWIHKRYIGRHLVFYNGVSEDKSKGIWGIWEIGKQSRGGFHIWPEGLPDPTGTVLRAEAELPVPQETGTVLVESL